MDKYTKLATEYCMPIAVLIGAGKNMSLKVYHPATKNSVGTIVSRQVTGKREANKICKEEDYKAWNF